MLMFAAAVYVGKLNRFDANSKKQNKLVMARLLTCTALYGRIGYPDVDNCKTSSINGTFYFEVK